MTNSAWITGLGTVTALGKGVEAFFSGLRRGEAALSPVEGIPIARKKRLAAQVKDAEFAGPTRVSAMAARAVAEAVNQAALGQELLSQAGLYVGTAAGESRMAEDLFSEFAGAEELSDQIRQALLRFANGAVSEVLAERFGIGGPRDTNTNACASGNIAIARALTAIRAGRIKLAVVCGVDQLKPTTYWGTERAGLMGHDLRPFHRDRDGTVFGDGAGALILEDPHSAAARGATCLAEVAGFGLVCDENPQLIVPQLDGGAAVRVFLAALADAGVETDQIDYINAHGTGTKNIDRVEAIACQRVFGDRAVKIPINSTKSITGHLSAASPIVEAIATVLAISQGYIHPTAKLDVPDPELKLDFVPLRGRNQEVRYAVSNSMGGGGTNAAVVLTAPAAKTNSRPQMIPLDEIVITGIGALSCFGVGAESLRAGLYQHGSPAGGRLASFDINAHVEPSLGYQHLSRSAQLALVAGMSAATDGGLPTPFENPDRLGVVMGTVFGGTAEWSEMLCEAYTRDPRLITPNVALEHGHHLGVTLLARRFQARGATCTLTEGPTSGLEAIAFGGDLLRNRTCDCVIAGGCDALDRPLEKAMQLMRCSASGSEGVPYQSTSNGYVPGEGAGFVILERRETAVARNARIYGRIRGFASAGSRVRLGSVDGEGKAARQALREAVGTLPLRGRDVAVFGAANGTRLLDHAELAVVKSVALDGGWRPKLVSLHGTLGETLGAGSVLSTIAGLMTLREGKVPSWRGETSTSPDASFAVGNSKWSTPWLIVNAAGFGGAASSLVVEVAPEIDNVG